VSLHDSERRADTRRIALALVVSLILSAMLFLPALAQPEAAGEVRLVNLSHSGAASNPVVLSTRRGTMQFFWWDRFDGLTTALYYSGNWSDPKPAPILVPTEEGKEIVLKQIEAMPRIFADDAERAHAFWLGKADKETELRPLMHSTLSLGTASWSAPVAVAESASAWQMLLGSGGLLHLFYFRPTHTDIFPSGLYHQRSSDGGATWTAPAALHVSLHFRRTAPETSHLEAALDPAGNIYVAWDDPEVGQSVYCRSANAGDRWTEARPFHAGALTARQVRLGAVGASQVLAIWEGTGIAAGQLYQQLSLDGGRTWQEPQRVLEDLAGASGLRLWTVAKGRLLLGGGRRRGMLALAMWGQTQWRPPDESGWSDRQFAPLATDVAGVGARVDVERWHGVLLAGVLTLVGQGLDGEVWAARVNTDAIPWSFGPPPPWAELTPEATAGPSAWSAPLNLSRSGSASDPKIVPGPDGSGQVFWWDRFDGLMSAYYDGASWFAALPSPIMVAQTVGGEIVSRPVEVMPRIVGDAVGQAHALWSTSAGARTGPRPLLHSRLTLGTTRWSLPGELAESAVAWELASDPRGVLHLAYIRDLNTPAQSAGIYYRRSVDGGATWAEPVLLHPSVYLRLLTPENTHLAVLADGAGRVFVTWDDPRSGEALYTRSENGGVSWEEVRALGAADAGARRSRFLSAGGDDTLLLSEGAALTLGGGLYQRRSQDGGASWGEPQRVLPALQPPLQGATFYQAADGSALMVLGGGSSSLRVAAWEDLEGGRWSEPESVALSFQNPETGSPVYLEALHGALCGESFVVVGLGQDSEVWALQRPIGQQEWVFAPPSPWLRPERIADMAGSSTQHAVAVDAEGVVHVLWDEAQAEGSSAMAIHYARWDGSRWARAYRVLVTPEGRVSEPSLVAVGDRLHAVAISGPGGDIVYAQAFTRDAYASGAWSEPVLLPGPPRVEAVGGSPVIRAGLGGELHVVYVVPLNEGRGIYYTRSDDGGNSWSPAETVFDAEGSGWAMVEHPALAVDVDGAIHVAWVRAPLPGNPVTEGIYYARSLDGGLTWSEPWVMAEGAYDWPELGLSRPQAVHLVWSSAAGSGDWMHRWSVNGGRHWTASANVSGLRQVAGPARLAYDGFETLYLLGLATDDAGEPALIQSAWDDGAQRWIGREMLQVGPTVRRADRLAVALSPSVGRLAAAFWGSVSDGTGTAGGALFFSQREVPALELEVALYITPQPTPTFTPIPTPAPTATPTPVVNLLPPPQSPPGLELGPISLPLGALLGVLLVGAMVVGVLLVRSVGVRR